MRDRTVGIGWRVGLIGLLWFAAACGDEGIRSASGSWSSNEGLSIMGGVTVWETGKPGVMLGLVQTPGAEQRLSYLAFFEHSATLQGEWSTRENSKTANDGRIATSDHSLSIDGREFRAAVRIEWDRLKGIVADALQIDGRDVNTSDGRVLLVDLRGEQSRVQQVEVDLPKPNLSPESGTDASRAYVTRVVGALRNRDDVRGFFDAAK